MPGAVADKTTWELAEGDEIAPGRTVLKLLGGGHRYEVYLVWDDKLFTVMVAKVLRPDIADDESAIRSLRREWEALEALAHPVLLRGFGAELEGPYPHVLVEHLEGPTLRRLIKKSAPLPVQQVLPLALNVASVIHYMASEGWVHLDIKPDNLVMGIPPRLIDLSLARTVERARELKDYIGTNAYMPPEQCVPGDPWEVGPPADVWGLGATLYHAIAGKLPFERPRSRDDDASLEDRFPQLYEEPWPWPVRVPPALDEAIMACLRADPAERPTAGELAQSLEPLVAALPKKLVLGRRGPVLP
jgi:eukaryotic-like serine/threonine-protein kinase